MVPARTTPSPSKDNTSNLPHILMDSSTMASPTDPFLAPSDQQGPPPSPSPTRKTLFPHILKGIWKAVESVLDWSPFIVVQTLQGSYPPTFSLGWGTGAAAGLLLFKFLAECGVSPPISSGNGNAENTVTTNNGPTTNNGSLDGGRDWRNWTPSTMDLGQFLLFGFLYVSAQIATGSSDGEYAGNLLILWFNPFTTGGMALIMYTSILRGKPFVYDYVKKEMPEFVFNRLISKKWFREKVDQVAIFWVKILVCMTLIVCVHPLLVTVFFGGDDRDFGKAEENSGVEENSVTGGDFGKADLERLNQLGNILTVGQFVILAYGMFRSAVEGGRQERIKKRVKQVKETGLEPHLQELYPAVSVKVQVPLGPGSHRIRTLTTLDELRQAANILAYAFRHDDIFDGFLQTTEARFTFFHASLCALSCFNSVLGCFRNGFEEDKEDKLACQCVMVLVRLISKSQEELEVFNTYEAWVEHGFEVQVGRDKLAISGKQFHKYIQDTHLVRSKFVN